MTELQPTEIELTGKKKSASSLSRRKIIAFVAVVLVCALIAGLTAILAHRASRTPEIIQQGAVPASEVAPSSIAP